MNGLNMVGHLTHDWLFHLMQQAIYVTYESDLQDNSFPSPEMTLKFLGTSTASKMSKMKLAILQENLQRNDFMTR